jgi:2-polyprenyl-3-methyl-5-hydroxy-6-metoxy-1,4-benzoquinol methylase
LKRPSFDQNWPPSWKTSYFYDLEEVYGPISNPGYAYAYQKRRRETIRLLSEVLPRGARILDVGAAQGNFSLTLAEMGYEVTWNDMREELADYVRLKHEHGKLSFAPGNAFEIKAASLFDGVLITEIIEHMAHPNEFLARVAELIRPGGYIVMTSPNGAYFRNNLPKFSECSDPAIYEDLQFKPDSDGHIFLFHQPAHERSYEDQTAVANSAKGDGRWNRESHRAPSAQPDPAPANSDCRSLAQAGERSQLALVTLSFAKRSRRIP